MLNGKLKFIAKVARHNLVQLLCDLLEFTVEVKRLYADLIAAHVKYIVRE